MRVSLRLLTSLGIATGCSVLSAPADDGARELVEHEAQWQRAAVHSYSFTYRVEAMLGSPPVRIEVRADTVARVVDQASGATLPRDRGLTIDALFAEIAAARQRPDYQVTVSYDAQRGFPIRIVEDGHAGDRGAILLVEDWTAGT